MLRCTARCALLIAGLTFSTQSVNALANPTETSSSALQASSGKTTEDVWPADCTRDIPRDGVVLINEAALPGEGALQVSLQVAGGGAAVSGGFDTERSTSSLRVWRSDSQLLANTEYKLQVQRGGKELISHFITGESAAAPLRFAGRPAARVLEGDQPDVAVVRIAVPGLEGGLTHRELELSAALGDGSAQDATLTKPRQPAALEFEVVLGDQAQTRCVHIEAKQSLSETVVLGPQFCVEVPARSGASDEAAADQQELSQVVYVTTAGLTQASESTIDEQAQGCSVGSQRRPDLSWLLLAMLPLLARRSSRKQAA